jgi:hypothetical protein
LHTLRLMPGPPNLTLSRQCEQVPQSSSAIGAVGQAAGWLLATARQGRTRRRGFRASKSPSSYCTSTSPLAHSCVMVPGHQASASATPNCASTRAPTRQVPGNKVSVIG